MSHKETYYYQKKKINNSKIQLLHAGADRKLHGINKMIYLIHKLPNNLKKNIHLKIICNDYLNDYKNQITKLKCEDQIRLIKPLSYKNYFKMIKNADICMGLFGNTEKTESVVSNFIVTSANLGKVIITKKTKAAQIYLNENMVIFSPILAINATKFSSTVISFFILVFCNFSSSELF